MFDHQKLAWMNGAYFSGGGGLTSTAEDYLRFALLLANLGELDGTRLLSRRSVEMLASAFAPDTLPGRNAGEAFGLGVRVVTDSAARTTWLSPGSFGWSGAFACAGLTSHNFVSPLLGPRPDAFHLRLARALVVERLIE